jgi:ribosomal protein S1
MTKAKKVRKEGSLMAKLLKEKDLQMKELHPGDLIDGVVITVTHGEVLIDVGAKSEGIVSGSELEDADIQKSLKPGDPITAKVVQAENAQGYIVLSLRKAEKDRKWKDAEEALATGAVLEATIIEYNKGGLLCDCLNLRGFIPLSHLDRSHFANDIAKFAAGSEAEQKDFQSIWPGKPLKLK